MEPYGGFLSISRMLRIRRRLGCQYTHCAGGVSSVRRGIIESSNSRYKISPFNLFALAMNKCIETLEKHNNAG